jgi:hypothetical protein
VRTTALCAALLAALAVIAAPAAVAHKDPGGPVVGGLFNPRGIDVAPNGRLFVAESGSGEITRIRTWGRHAPKVSTFTTLPTLPGGPEDDPPALGPVEVVVSGAGKKFVLMSGPPRGETADEFGRLIQVFRSGRTRLIADIAAYQEGDVDPDDTEDFPEESNPNGLALLHGGKFLVADAAGNDLLLVDSRGRIKTVARFKPELVPFPAGLPFGPPAGTPFPAEAVPTAVAVGPDGAWYVSELKGFPFVKGTSRIWRIQPGSVGATCDPAAPNHGPCRTVRTGFTSVIDLAFGRHGTMYVLEIAKNGLLDAGLGALWRVKHGTKTELVPGTLLFPGGLAVEHDDLFVTTGSVFGPGAGGVVRVRD